MSPPPVLLQAGVGPRPCAVSSLPFFAWSLFFLFLGTGGLWIFCDPGPTRWDGGPGRTHTEAAAVLLDNARREELTLVSPDVRVTYRLQLAGLFRK